jgi:type III secretion system FlhB-like substrate exporter
MQRRQFLQNTLALGAAGMLPEVGLAGGQGADQADCSFDADVILVSEQKIVIALRYDETTMIAPVVQAKGDTKRILDTAAAKEIPLAIVEGQWINFRFIETMSSPPTCQAECGDWLVKLGYTESFAGGFGCFITRADIPEPPLVPEDFFDELNVGDVVPEKHYEIIAEIMRYDYFTEQKVNEFRKPPDSPYNFRLDGDLVLVSRQGVCVALRYDKKTMIAPIVRGKDTASQRLLKKFEEEVPRVCTTVKVPGNSPFAEILHSLEHVRCFLVDEQEESVVQDLYDNTDIYEVIPEKYYECIADILERDRQITSSWARENGVLSQEEIEGLLTKMIEEQPDMMVPSDV